MKKKPVLKKKPQTKSSSTVKKVAKKADASNKREDIHIILIRSWAFLVLFAFMLGIGVIVGNYINAQMNGYPTVAGASTSR